jgi:hypothetical protein
MTSEGSNAFPHAVLTPLPPQRPTAAVLELLQQEVSANAISVPSSRGNGLLGHYALVVSPARYMLASGVAFIAPESPGIAPVHAANATGHMITEDNRQFLADQKEFIIFSATEAKLKQQILQAVPPTYTNSLKNKFIGFANVSALAILTHLFNDYGRITTHDLDENMKRLHKEWSPANPIEDLFEQIRSCREFAVNTDPISEAMAVRAGVAIIDASGVFGDAVRDWRKLADNEHTMVNFITDFKRADAERQRQLTTKSAGYHNVAAKTTMVQQPNTTNGNTTNANTITTLHYCWTHGAGPNPNHTSQTCIGPAPGHRHEACLTNMLGGNNIIHRRRGETQVFVPPKRKATLPTPAPTTSTPLPASA